MEKAKGTKFKNMRGRITICIIGMFFYASGVALTKNCKMGISPTISVAYALSLITPISLGWCTTIYNLPLFAIQRLLRKKQYPLRMMVAQFTMSAVFSVMIDLTAKIWSFVAPTNYAAKLVIFVFGCFVLAFGLTIVVKAELVMLPAEGAVSAIAERTGQKFGNVKILFDAAMVVITVVATLAFLGRIDGIREGTIIAVLLIGTFSKAVNHLFAGIHTFAKNTDSNVRQPE